MLVFTRKPGQSIMIGDDIQIVAYEIGSGQIKIGIEAPKEIPVHRREVFDAIKAIRKAGGA